MSLKEYRRKRKFDQTPEPRGEEKHPKKAKAPLRFVVQKHAATRTHYDFRLEFGGTLKSWAVPRGPTLTSNDPRLAVFVEDHPLEYGEFEGAIPKGNYGAGTVMLWDEGTYVERNSQGRSDSEEAMREGLAKGHLTFVLDGQKLRGEFALVKIKKKGADEKSWLLIKKHDAEASRHDVRKEDRSVTTRRSMEEIAAQATAKGEIWIPGKGRLGKAPAKKSVAKSAKPKTATKVKPAPKPKKIAVRDVKPIPGAVPRRQKPMEPVFASSPPHGAEWLFEAFGAGTRAVAEIEPPRAKLHSRSLLPLEKKYPAVVRALKEFGHQAVLDGEIVREGEDTFFRISDLLYLDGADWREVPLQQRKQTLAKLNFEAPLQLAKWKEGAPPAEPVEQLVAKRLDSTYRSGLTRDWLRYRTGASSAEKPTIDTPPLTHPEKIFWVKEKITKGDLFQYYDSISELILPYLIDRPQSLHRQPDGLRNEGFFHKDMSGFLPKRIQSERVFSESAGRTINYALCQDRWSLLYLINLGCIELNPWLSRRQNLDKPDLVVIDLDPDDNPFKEVVEVARAVHEVLEAVGAESYCKTSGASGLHICIPTGGNYDYEIGRLFAEKVCRIVNAQMPKNTSVERNPAKRRRKIYLDFLQNRRAQTLAAPYCVRPKPGATVSAPLKWSEVKNGLSPADFTIKTLPKRLEKVGDLWRPMLETVVDLEKCLAALEKKFP